MGALKTAAGWGVRVVSFVAGFVLFLVLWEAGADWLRDRTANEFFALRASSAPTDTTVLGAMPRELVESSGLALSRAHRGVVWSHNDSGDGPWIYQMDTTATLKGRVRVSDAGAIDWESMDLGPCPAIAEELPEWCIYAADVGDNDRRRDTLTIYIVAEPDPQAADTSVTSLARLRYGYAGTNHDVEAVAVAPSGDLAITTKGRTRDIVTFTVTAASVAEAVRSGEVFQLSGGVRLPIEPDWDIGRVTTGASISSDGSLLAVRTYSEVYFFEWPLADPPREAAAACLLGSYEPQGEAVAFWSDGRLMTSSETWSDRPGYLSAFRCSGVQAPGPYEDTSEDEK